MQFVISRTRCLLLAFLLVLTVGCNSKTAAPTAGTGEDGEAASAPDGGRSKKTLIPIKRDVKSIEGNWVVVVTNQRTDAYQWIVKFTRGADGKTNAELLEVRSENGEKDPLQLVSSEVDGDSVKLVFKRNDATFDFMGTFQQGFIRGTLKAGATEVYLARLLPTDEKSLERFDPNGLPPGSDVYDGLMKRKDLKPDELMEAAREHRTSPLTQDIYSTLMNGSSGAKLDEATLNALIQDYRESAKIWGPRWQVRTEMIMAVSLINGRQYTRMALEHLDAAERYLGDDKATYAETINAFREAAKVNLRVEDIASESASDETKAAAFDELSELLKKQPYNAEILYALATHAERTGKTEIAMNYLSEIVAMPMLELALLRARAGQPPDSGTATELLKKLWAQKNGSEEGYQEYVDEVYRRRIGEYLDEIQKLVPTPPPAEMGDKTVLVELYTGMQCPPCVSADLALAAIRKTYPHNNVVIVRLHQHIPLPDGLANQDSEERGAFYGTGATPTIVVNGMLLDGRFYAGPIQMAGNAYTVLRRVIDPLVVEKTDVRLDISAEVVDGQLQVSAAATGIPEELLPSCRLRLAVVENELHTIVPEGSNGIRDHEFLVREMLGGAKGIPPKKGELKYSISLPVSDLQQHVVDYIQRYEAGRRFEFPPAMKPPIQGPLSLVAWVQNDKADEQTQSRLILQTAVTPIKGETGFGPAATVSAVEETPAATSTETEAPKSEPSTEQPETPPAEADATPPSDTTPESSDATPDSASESTPPPPALPEE
ncbi:hypothetical protein [Schlesneria sp. T3-172]|uniref:hypothetical protein n=1 Tax=Schlesneria TaxID=656899 RepID=UPI002EF61BE6